MRNFTCTHCGHSVPVGKFAFRARSHTPINCTPFSVIELNCPECHQVNASVVVPSNLSFGDLPIVLENALDNVSEFHYHLCEDTQNGKRSS
jgi:hypothetical protein